MLKGKPKGYPFPVEIISFVVWSYHRFNDSYRDIRERLLYRGISVSHETARNWCIRFGAHFHDVIKKREARPADKWHLDEMLVTVNGEKFWLWRAVDKDGYELDVSCRNGATNVLPYVSIKAFKYVSKVTGYRD